MPQKCLQCETRASYNTPGEPARYCAKHRQGYMVYSGKCKRCEFPGCQKVPSYGAMNQPKRTHCTTHKTAGMDRKGKRATCKVEGCFKRPHYGLLGSTLRTHCQVHKEDSMECKGMQMVCADPGCDKRPHYGFIGQPKRTHCTTHKFGRMEYKGKTTVACSAPNCSKRAVRGQGTEHFCKLHKDGDGASYLRTCTVLSGRRRNQHGYGLGKGRGDREATWEKWEYGTFERYPIGGGDEPEINIGDELPPGPEEAETLSLGECQRAVEILSGFIQEERMERLREVLQKRTGHVRVVFEEPSNPNNSWAGLRTVDSFGIQRVDVVMKQQPAGKRKRLKTMCSALGSQKWLSLNGHSSAKDMADRVKADGYRLIGSDLSPGAKPISEINWDEKTAVVFGNEETGISPEMREACEETFYLPMMGFAESFNLSVSLGITLTHILCKGGIIEGDFTEDERERVMLKWLLSSVRGSNLILKRAGINLVAKTKREESIGGFTTRL